MALLNANQVAERLGIHPRTVKNLAAAGAIVGIKIAHAWRFEESDVDAFIAKQKTKTAEEVQKTRQKAG